MGEQLRIVAWNLNHRGNCKSVPTAVADALAALKPEVLVLTEYVDGEHQAVFRSQLEMLDFKHIALSVYGPDQNRVLMASRSEMSDDDLLTLPGFTESATTNWLHRRFPALGIDVIGMRAPSYKPRWRQRAYWHQVTDILHAGADRPLLMIGDVNCDPFSDGFPGSLALNALSQQGFSLPNPGGAWSYIGHQGARTRIDHAISTPALTIHGAQYVTRVGTHVLAGPKNTSPLSDHAALVVNVAAPANR